MGQKKFVATGSTWGPTGSAFTSGSEPDTDCLLYHVAAGHCFRDTFDEQ